jgi:hypothetical protein
MLPLYQQVAQARGALFDCQERTFRSRSYLLESVILPLSDNGSLVTGLMEVYVPVEGWRSSRVPLRLLASNSRGTGSQIDQRSGSAMSSSDTVRLPCNLVIEVRVDGIYLTFEAATAASRPSTSTASALIAAGWSKKR